MQMCPKCGWNNFDTARFCSRCGEPLRGLLGQGEVLQGRYHIVQLLGCGGMGAVYLAKDLRLNRYVAIKENFDTSPEATDQFRLEAEILANLHHSNLPQVFDYFVEPKTGKQYLVMDYISGEDLEDLVRRKGPLSERDAMRILESVMDAVAYLHSQNPPIIHRDIKPANIKVQRDGSAILVDFGIAKRYHPGKETVGGAAAVTPGYSPPEQYGQGITDPRSDIYALGATLYFALTGQAPPDAIERVTRGDHLIPPKHFNPHISAHIERAILKAMALRPADRFPSVNELKRALLTPVRRKPSPRRNFSPPRPQPLPTSNQGIDMMGCTVAFFEGLFWILVLMAIFGGCRGCFVIWSLSLLAFLTGWIWMGWSGAALLVLSVWAGWHLLFRLSRLKSRRLSYLFPSP